MLPGQTAFLLASAKGGPWHLEEEVHSRRRKWRRRPPPVRQNVLCIQVQWGLASGHSGIHSPGSVSQICSHCAGTATWREGGCDTPHGARRRLPENRAQEQERSLLSFNTLLCCNLTF